MWPKGSLFRVCPASLFAWSPQCVFTGHMAVRPPHPHLSSPRLCLLACLACLTSSLTPPLICTGPEIRKVLRMLDQSKSTYCTPFAKLCKEVFTSQQEANDVRLQISAAPLILRPTLRAAGRACTLLSITRPEMHRLVFVGVYPSHAWLKQQPSWDLFAHTLYPLPHLLTLPPTKTERAVPVHPRAMV